LVNEPERGYVQDEENDERYVEVRGEENAAEKDEDEVNLFKDIADLLNRDKMQLLKKDQSIVIRRL